MYDVSAQGVDERMINVHYYLHPSRMIGNDAIFGLIVTESEPFLLFSSFFKITDSNAVSRNDDNDIVFLD